MNILHLEASTNWGGQEIRILREAEGMRARGHQVFFVVAKGGKLISYARKEGFLVYEGNFRKSGWPLLLFQLLHILRRHHIEIINTHSSLDSWIGGIAARIARVRVVRTRHLSSPIKGGLNGYLLYGKLADFIVTTCRSIIPMICSQSGKPEGLCRSIATGVDPAKVRADEAERATFRTGLGLREGDFLVGTACMMRSWKGIRDLLAAADQLREHPHIRWVVIGGGHADEYITAAKELRLDGIVHFTGHLENPFPAIAALDAFALLSTAHEGISQAILQAAYLSRPLIATATGGLPEVCLGGVTGIQVAPFAPEEVAQAVVTLYGDPALRQSYGTEARRLVEERFTIKSTIDEMEKVYNSVYF